MHICELGRPVLTKDSQVASALENVQIDDEISQIKASLFNKPAPSPKKQPITPKRESTELKKGTKKTTVQEDEDVYEPLLAENKRRFVLFPLKYHDVSVPAIILTSITSLTRDVDLANVQKGRGFFLDCRGN